jgi:hypothetical protein
LYLRSQAFPVLLTHLATSGKPPSIAWSWMTGRPADCAPRCHGYQQQSREHESSAHHVRRLIRLKRQRGANARVDQVICLLGKLNRRTRHHEDSSAERREVGPAPAGWQSRSAHAAGFQPDPTDSAADLRYLVESRAPEGIGASVVVAVEGA